MGTTCGPTFKIFLALKAYFEGKAANIEITAADLKPYSIINYLERSTGIYSDFFEAFPYLFSKNTGEFTEAILKYFRRLEACK